MLSLLTSDKFYFNPFTSIPIFEREAEEGALQNKFIEVFFAICGYTEDPFFIEETPTKLGLLDYCTFGMWAVLTVASGKLFMKAFTWLFTTLKTNDDISVREIAFATAGQMLMMCVVVIQAAIVLPRVVLALALTILCTPGILLVQAVEHCWNTAGVARTRFLCTGSGVTTKPRLEPRLDTAPRTQKACTGYSSSVQVTNVAATSLATFGIYAPETVSCGPPKTPAVKFTL